MFQLSSLLASLRQRLSPPRARNGAAAVVLSDQLRETAQEIEQSVVSVCENFQSMSGRARDLVGEASRILEGGESGCGVESLITTSRGAFDSLLGRMEHESDLSARAIAHMEQVQAVMKSISGILVEIESIAFSNRLLALNAKIEAVRVGDMGAGFAVVADEIAYQAQRSTALVDEIDGVTKRLTEAMRASVSDLREIAKVERERVADSRREIESALDGLDKTYSDMRRSITGASERSERLADDICQAVVGLQFQDRVNQRIAHVADALTWMNSTEKGNDSAAEPAAGDALARIGRACTMQAERSVLARSTGQAATADADGPDVELF